MATKLPILIQTNSLPKQVRHPYSFTQQFAKFKFSINETRIIIRILQVIKDIQQYERPIQIDINKNVEIRFKVRDLMLDNSNAYERVYDALKVLREHTLKNPNATIIDEKGRKIPATELFGFIETATYSNNNSIVSIKMKDYWFKYLMDLSHGYTQYLADTVFVFTHSFSSRFYFFIKHWSDKEGLTLNYQKFIEDFEIPKDYNLSKIENRILAPVRKELNKVAEKSFNWRITYTNGYERNSEQPKPKGRGIKPSKITLKFYTIEKNEPVKLTDFDHTRAQVFLDELMKKYKLKGDTPNILYGLFRRYGLHLFIATEKELKNLFKGLTDMDFVNKITVEVRKSCS